MPKERQKKNNLFIYLSSIVSISSLCFFIYLKFQILNFKESTNVLSTNKIKILGGNTDEPKIYNGGKDEKEEFSGVVKRSAFQIFANNLKSKTNNEQSITEEDVAAFLFQKETTIDDVLKILINTIQLPKVNESINQIYKAFKKKENNNLVKIFQAFKDSSITDNIVLGESFFGNASDAGASNSLEEIKPKIVLNKKQEEYKAIKEVYTIEELKPFVILKNLKVKYNFNLEDIRKSGLYNAKELAVAGYRELNDYINYNKKNEDLKFTLLELLRVGFTPVELNKIKDFKDPNEYLQIYRKNKDEKLIDLKIMSNLFKASEMNYFGISAKEWFQGGATIDWFIPEERDDEGNLLLAFTEEELFDFFNENMVRDRTYKLAKKKQNEENSYWWWLLN